MTSVRNSIVCITGASSGIGAACAAAFAREGAALLLMARRLERIEQLGRTLTGQYGVRVQTVQLDVRDQNAVQREIESLPAAWQEIEVLVNNAGLSRGLDTVQEGKILDWDEMIDTNVKGLLYVTRAVLPGMVARNRGHVVNIGSIAGHEVYPGGNVYCASKFAVAAISRGMKMDLLGTKVRVSSVDPGLVETEFSQVRYRGDTERAAKTYKNMQPLSGDDIADIVLFCVTRPAHVNIADVIVLPTDQASVTHVHRSS